MSGSAGLNLSRMWANCLEAFFTSLLLRLQGKALEILSRADVLLADEYDAGQERGEVAGHGGDRGNQHGGKVSDENLATIPDIGLSRKQIHEARQIRDAEQADPGIVGRAI